MKKLFKLLILYRGGGGGFGKCFEKEEKDPVMWPKNNNFFREKVPGRGALPGKGYVLDKERKVKRS